MRLFEKYIAEILDVDVENILYVEDKGTEYIVTIKNTWLAEGYERVNVNLISVITLMMAKMEMMAKIEGSRAVEAGRRSVHNGKTV
jgi:hypothetical protein